MPLFSSTSSGCTLPEKPLSPVEWHVHFLSLFSQYWAIPCGSMMSSSSRLSFPLMKLSISFTVRVLWRNRWNAESARICVIRVRLERKLTWKLHYSRAWKTPTRRGWNVPYPLTINIIFHNNRRNSRVLIGLFSLSMNGQTHEFIRELIVKIQIIVSFSCICPVIDHEFRPNIVKAVCGSTQLSPHGSTVLWQYYDEIFDQSQDRCMKLTSIC